MVNVTPRVDVLTTPLGTHLRRASLGTALGVAAAAALIAGAFAPAALAQGATGASAILMSSTGQMVGSAVLTEGPGGVRLSVTARNLPPGAHGIHLHQVGRCDAPAFTSAGDHFNPTGRQHGLSNPAGPHAGDLPVLQAAAAGTASYVTTSTMITLGTGQTSLFDADGTALVIHANADDQMTDPSGNSGGRIACGVLVRGGAALPATGGGPAPHPAALAAAIGAAGMALTLAGRTLARRFRVR